MPLPNLCFECDKPLRPDEVYICQNCFEEQLIEENHRTKGNPEAGIDEEDEEDGK
jgi:predicted amidophosphoribosyltransferase|tara:strand:+ start:1242 stop:1406 length:165 start_codon:yes stop_codon:yes gene_type:complete